MNELNVKIEALKAQIAGESDRETKKQLEQQLKELKAELKALELANNFVFSFESKYRDEMKAAFEAAEAENKAPVQYLNKVENGSVNLVIGAMVSKGFKFMGEDVEQFQLKSIWLNIPEDKTRSLKAGVFGKFIEPDIALVSKLSVTATNHFRVYSMPFGKQLPETAKKLQFGNYTIARLKPQYNPIYRVAIETGGDMFRELQQACTVLEVDVRDLIEELV